MPCKFRKIFPYLLIFISIFIICGCSLGEKISETLRNSKQVNGALSDDASATETSNDMTEALHNTVTPTAESDPSSNPATLDKSSLTSIFTWLDFAIKNDDVDGMNALSADEVGYVVYIEGGDWKGKDRFLDDFSQRLDGQPTCIGKGVLEDGYGFVAWYSGWDPVWEVSESCYFECTTYDPPYTSDVVGFMFYRENGSYNLEKLWIAEPDLLVSIYPGLMGPCYTNQKSVSSDGNPSSTKISSCPDAPNQRLKVGGTATVCTKQDAVYLRDEPSRSGDVLLSLPVGTEMEVIGGPECANDWSWWKVRTSSGIVGWVSEGGDSIDPYFLCP